MASLLNFPSLDFSGLDAARLRQLDQRVLAVARDSAYVSIGFGVLAVRQAQLRRRELAKGLSAQATALVGQVQGAAEALGRQARGLVRPAA